MELRSGIIAQAYPDAGVLAEIYCTPENVLVQVNSIIATNHGPGVAKIKISLASEDAADDPKQYLVFDKEIPANEFILCPFTVYLRYEDMIRAASDTGNVSFNVLGAITHGY
jgi:hypothetical protein